MSETAVRMLIVDDDDTMRLICRRYFSRRADVRPLIIEEAEDGETAMRMMRERAYDLILSDYRMGAATGIDVLAFAMRERPKAVRVLFTGFASSAIHHAAIAQANVHEFFEKPMTTDELEAALASKIVEPFLKPLTRRLANLT